MESPCTATLALCLIKVPSLLLYTTLDFLACGQKAIAFTMVGKSQYHTAFLGSYQRTWNGDTCLIFMILFAYRKSHTVWTARLGGHFARANIFGGFNFVPCLLQFDDHNEVFNPQNTGGGCNQDAADSIACRSFCGKVRSVKLGVFVVYCLVNTWMKKKMGGCI